MAFDRTTRCAANSASGTGSQAFHGEWSGSWWDSLAGPRALGPRASSHPRPQPGSPLLRAPGRSFAGTKDKELEPLGGGINPCQTTSRHTEKAAPPLERTNPSVLGWPSPPASQRGSPRLRPRPGPAGAPLGNWRGRSLPLRRRRAPSRRLLHRPRRRRQEKEPRADPAAENAVAAQVHLPDPPTACAGPKLRRRMTRSPRPVRPCPGRQFPRLPSRRQVLKKLQRFSCLRPLPWRTRRGSSDPSPRPGICFPGPRTSSPTLRQVRSPPRLQPHVTSVVRQVPSVRRGARRDGGTTAVRAARA